MAEPIGKGGVDTPDWGVSSMINTNELINDHSELSVRLGGLSRFDRTGRIVFQEDFDAGLANWEHNSYPAAAFAVPTAEYQSCKYYSIKLKTTQDVGSVSGIARGVAVPYISRLGFEFHFKPYSTIDRFLATFYIYNGIYRYVVEMGFYQQTNTIFITDENGFQHEIDSYFLNSGSTSPFHMVKMVVDLSTEFYYRIAIDEKDYNVSDVGIRKTASATNPYLYMLYLNWSPDGNQRTIWLDNIIITIDEPR